jgi:hypothetical protein
VTDFGKFEAARTTLAAWTKSVDALLAAGLDHGQATWMTAVLLGLVADRPAND